MRSDSSPRRSALVVVASLLGFASLTGMGPFFSAPPREPQIPVVGTALHDRFVLYDQSIDVQNAQVDVQRWPMVALATCWTPGTPTATALIEIAGNASHRVYGVYRPNAPVPTLYPIFPSQAGDGWFAALSFRSAPDRLVVNLFDNMANHLGATTYPGVTKDDVGFYSQSDSGTLFSEDARNPGGDAQALVFRATGLNAGSWWMCWEDEPLQGSDHDFDDCLLYIDRGCGLPTSRTTWGRLKERFR